MLTLSITMAGVSSCSGSCSYCSAALSQNYNLLGFALKEVYTSKEKLDEWNHHIDDKTYKEFKIDSFRFKKTILNDRKYLKELEDARKQKRKPEAHIDLWGANPLSCRKALEETIDLIHNTFDNEWNVCLSISDNGIGIYSSYDLLEKYDMTAQLSHDGIGEWLRLPVDPCYSEPLSESLKKALLNKRLTSINCTLSRYNYSFYKNIKYWNDYFSSIKLPDSIRKSLYIKLNHVYDSDYDLKPLNVEGRWQDTIIEELKGKPIGSWQLYNGTNDYDKHVLDDYIEEYVKLGIQMRDPVLSERIDFKPFKSYIIEQTNRHTMFKDHDSKHASCRSYQRFKHKVGQPKSWDDQTFVIDTTGGYSECNLIDSNHCTENPGGPQPDYCNGCKFEFYEDCNTCGSMKYPNQCNYYYRHAQANQFFEFFDACIMSNKNVIKSKMISNLTSNLTRGI